MFIDPRMGLYKDLELYFVLPIVLSDQTKLKFDTGVNYDNSTVVQDYNDLTYDKENTLFLVPFNGPERSGFGDMHAGIRYAPFNQERDWTRPSWVVGMEWTFPTGQVKRTTNKGVGRGLYEMELYTALSRRLLPWVEPFFGLQGTLRFPSDASLFKDHGKTQTLYQPGHSLGIQLGTEIIPWEQAREDRRLTLEFGGGAEYTFEGRDYTVLFDALGGGQCSVDGACDLTRFKPGNTSLHHDPSDATKAPRSDGITDVENYGVFDGWVGLAIQPIKFVELGVKFKLVYEQGHFITFADAGKDLDGENNVQEKNGKGQNEFNPVYNETYDKIGTRFRVEDSLGYVLSFTLAGKF
jgi:hypothetical protein